MASTVSPSLTKDPEQKQIEKPTKSAAINDAAGKPELAGYLELFKYADAFDKTLMAVGTLCAVAFGAIQPVISLIIGDVSEAFAQYGIAAQKAVLGGSINQAALDAAKNRLQDAVVYQVILFAVIGVGASVAAYIARATWSVSGQRQARRIRQKFLTAILDQDVRFFDDNQVGDLTSRLSSDTTLLQEGISEKLALSAAYITQFIAGFIIAFVSGWKLTLILLAVTPILGIAGAVVGKVFASASAASQQVYAKSGAVAQEALSNIRTVVAFNGQERVITRYDTQLEDSVKINVARSWKAGAGFGVFFSSLYGIYALAFWYGAVLVDEGEMKGGDILKVIFGIIIGAFATIGLTPSMQAVNAGRGVARKLFSVIESNPSIPSSSSEEGEHLSKVSGRIEFRNISFAYPKRPDLTVLKDFSLVVEPGETVALVGFSGSGKSTVIQLLERFYDPQSGEILLDDRPLKSINVRSLRNSLGLVSQEPILFDATIEENIRYGAKAGGKPVTTTDIENACKIANIHEFIVSRLSAGYQTQTGEKGALLSGGQKQRIAIARAIISNPQILLLDEATSALDSESERIVQEALDSAAKDRTTIVIAHRLSTIKNAHKIVVMDKGQIVEIGDHQSLMERGGQYASLVKAQDLRKGTAGLVKSVDSDRAETAVISAVTAEKDTTALAIDSTVSDEKSKENSGSAPRLTPEEQKKLENQRILKENKVPWKRIFQLQRPELRWLILGLFVSVINGGMLPAFGVIFGQVTGALANTGEELRSETSKWALVFLGLMFLNYIVNFLQFGAFGVTGENLTRRLRTSLFKAILRQDISFFDQKSNGTGVLTAKLSDEPELVQRLMVNAIGSLIQLFTSMLTAIIISFVYSWRMTLVVLATVPILALANTIETRLTWLSANDPKVRKAYEKASQTACDAIANIRTVKSLTIESEITDSYYDSITVPYKSGLRKASLGSIGFGFTQGAQFWIYAIAFYAGYRFVFDGVLSGQDMFTVLFTIIFGTISFGQAAAQAGDIVNAKVAAIKIFKMVDQVPTIDPYSESGEKPLDVEGRALLDNVEFSYPQRSEIIILNGVSINVEAGKSVALVGPSGSGKSTVVAMVERFYDPQKGSVSMEGKDVKQWNVPYLRQQLAIVSQEPTLFIGTIAENISYGRPFATPQEIQGAAKQANIHKFIAGLPQGYQTEVSNSQLSGGQKQRIAIARALLCKPKILLLDEATSALDSESEKLVQDAINEASRGRTSITIAHRLSTIQNSDVIVVMENGKVVEQGTHNELIGQGGLYSALVKKQSLSS